MVPQLDCLLDDGTEEYEILVYSLSLSSGMFDMVLSSVTASSSSW